MAAIREADLPRVLDAVGRLWLEYLTWGNEGLGSRYGFRLPVREAVEHDLATIAKFQPPDGHLLLAFEGDAAFGTACMRRIEPDTSEIKRMWVQPEHVLAGSVTILPFDEHAAEVYGSIGRTWRRMGDLSPSPTSASRRSRSFTM